MKEELKSPEKTQTHNEAGTNRNKKIIKILITVLIIISYLLVLLFTLFVQTHISAVTRQTFLSEYYVYLLDLTFFLLIIAFIFNIKYIKKIFKETGKKSLLLILLIAIIGTGATAFLKPKTHRSFYDEDIYNSIGQDIASNHKAVMCNEGYYEDRELKLIAEEYNKQPAGYPYIISFIFRIFDTNELYTFIFNNIIYGFTIIVVFLIAYMLFNNQFLALVAGLTYMLIPANLQWFNTCSVEPATAFFSAVTVLATLLYIKNKKPINLFFCVVSLAFAVSFRTESVLLIFIILFIVLLKDIRMFLRQHTYAFLALLFLLFTGIVIHLLTMMGYDWGAGNASKFSFNYFFSTLGTNSIFYFNNKEFPVMYTILAIAGFFIFKNKNYYIKEKLILFSWFLVFWGIFLFFYAGTYRYGEGLSVRFSLLSYIPISILIASGVCFITDILGKFIKSEKYIKYAKYIMVFAIVYNVFLFLPFIRSEAGGESEFCRMDHQYAMEFIKLMPENSIIFTHNPNMFLIHKQSAVQTSKETYNPGIIQRHLSRFRGGVYVHYNYWSQVTYAKIQTEFTQNILNKYNYQIVKEYYYKNKKYGLYKIINLK